MGEGVDGRGGAEGAQAFAQAPSRRAHGIARRIALGAPRLQDATRVNNFLSSKRVVIIRETPNESGRASNSERDESTCH